MARSAPRPPFGWPEVPVAAGISPPSFREAGKALLFTPVRESSGEIPRQSSMPTAFTFLKNRVGFTATVEGRFAAVVAAIHIAAFAIMLWSEVDVIAKTIFILAWGFLNFFWLAVLRRPGLSAALSLVMLIVLILLSRFKHDILFMTASFVDVMIIDVDTFAFLMTVSSDLRYAVAAVFVVGVPTLVLLWRLDPFRVRLHAASIGGGSCLVGLSCLSLIFPIAPHNAFYSDDYVSNFVRSGVAAISELMTHGFMESDAVTCRPARTGDRCDLPAGRQAPAHHHGARRVEFRHHHRTRNSGSPRLSPAFRVVRWQDPIFHGRRRRRSDFVPRIQRSRRPFCKILRTLRLFRHSDRRRPGRARPAAHARPLRLPDPHPLSLAGRFPRCAQFSKINRHRVFCRRQGHGHGRTGARSVLLRSGPAGHRTGAEQGPAFHLRVFGGQSFSLGLPLSPGADAAMARPRKPTEDRRVLAAADDECARLCRVSRPPQTGIPERILSSGALRRPSAGIRDEHHRSGA